MLDGSGQSALVVIFAACVSASVWVYLSRQRHDSTSNSDIVDRLAEYAVGPQVTFEQLVAKKLTSPSSHNDLDFFEKELALEVSEQRLRRQEIQQEEKRYQLLRKYASQGLAQSKLSFKVSLVAAAIGFTFLLLGVAISLCNSDASKALVPVIVGSVVDAVAALFFIQDRRMQATMVNFFDRLREDRKLDEALKLVDQITDEAVKARTQALLALNFVGVNDYAVSSLCVSGPALSQLGQDSVDEASRERVHGGS